MGKDDARIGIDLEQVLQTPHVAAGLQHPALAGTVPLEVLQLPEMEGVRRPGVCMVHPVLVRWHAELIVEQGRTEAVGHQGHALLRQPRAHRMHGPESRHRRVDRRQDRLAARDPRIGVKARPLRGWGGKHALPGHRHTIGGILGKDVVQDRGAGARQADDEHRLHDLLLRDRRILRPIAHEQQAVDEVPQHALARDHPADGGEMRLLLQRTQQDGQRFQELLITKILQSARACRGFRQYCIALEAGDVLHAGTLAVGSLTGAGDYTGAPAGGSSAVAS